MVWRGGILEGSHSVIRLCTVFPDLARGAVVEFSRVLKPNARGVLVGLFSASTSRQSQVLVKLLF